MHGILHPLTVGSLCVRVLCYLCVLLIKSTYPNLSSKISFSSLKSHASMPQHTLQHQATQMLCCVCLVVSFLWSCCLCGCCACCGVELVFSHKLLEFHNTTNTPTQHNITNTTSEQRCYCCVCCVCVVLRDEFRGVKK